MKTLPKPKGDEAREDFIARFMGDPRAIAEFEDVEDRKAAAATAFDGEKEPATSSMTNGETIRVNIRANVITDQIRREKRDGRDVVVVPSYTLPDNIVMNGILYPAEEIAKSYKSLEGTPAPLGHPKVNSMFVSAKHPLGLNIGYFGAYNANCTRVDGRVFIEKVIDVERATESAMGRRVLAALDSGKPIHTSTGLLMNIRECTSSDLADWEGFDMEFDHDAILLDEDGAATPEQGVGMLVNDAKVRVINSDIETSQQEYIDMLGTDLISAMRRGESASIWGTLKEAINEVLGLGRELEPRRKEAYNMADSAKTDGADKLAGRLDALEQQLKTLDEIVSNMCKVTSANAAFIEALNADREAEKKALVNQIVEAELLSEEDAKATPASALKALLAANAKQKPKPAPGIIPGFSGAPQGDNIAQFDPLAVAKEA